MMLKQERIQADTLYFKKEKKNPTTGVKKAATDSYGININYE